MLGGNQERLLLHQLQRLLRLGLLVVAEVRGLQDGLQAHSDSVHLGRLVMLLDTVLKVVQLQRLLRLGLLERPMLLDRPMLRRSSNAATQHNAPASSSGKYATKMRGIIAASKTKRIGAKPASSVLSKSSKATVAKAPEAKDMSVKKTSTAMASGAKRSRTSLSADSAAAKPAATHTPAAQHSSSEPTKMDRKDFAKQMKASGNNLKKVRTSLSDEFIMEWKGNRYNQPKPMSAHTADEHFEKMIDHHDHGLDAKDRGDKSGARAHFNTRDHHFSHYVEKATDADLHKRKLNMHKVRAMLDIKEEANPLNKVMSVYRKLRAV